MPTLSAKHRTLYATALFLLGIPLLCAAAAYADTTDTAARTAAPRRHCAGCAC